MLNVFGPDERRGLAASLFSSLRCIVQQRLVPSPKGGRHAVREYLALDQPMRDALQAAPPQGAQAMMERMTEERGMPLLRAAERDAELGLIGPSALAAIRAERGGGPGSRDDARWGAGYEASAGGPGDSPDRPAAAAPGDLEAVAAGHAAAAGRPGAATPGDPGAAGRARPGKGARP
jgi:hypothetical protein